MYRSISYYRSPSSDDGKLAIIIVSVSLHTKLSVYSDKCLRIEYHVIRRQSYRLWLTPSRLSVISYSSALLLCFSHKLFWPPYHAQPLTAYQLLWVVGNWPKTG